MELWVLVGLVLKQCIFSGWEIKALSREFFSLTARLPNAQGFWEQLDRNPWMTSQKMIKGWIKTHEAKLLLITAMEMSKGIFAQGFEDRIKFALPVLPDAFKLICLKSWETMGTRWSLKPEERSIIIWSEFGFFLFIVIDLWLDYICLKLKY